MSADRMPTGRGIAQLATVPDSERRDGGPELVIRGEHPWLVSSRQAVPVLPRRRDQIREPVEELKRREFDDAVGTRECGQRLSRALKTDASEGCQAWESPRQPARHAPISD
jgi:hypothetical protein